MAFLGPHVKNWGGSMDIVRIVRVMEYVGPRAWVEQTLNRGAVPANGVHSFDIPNGHCEIRSATLGQFPEVMAQAKEADK